MKHFTLTASLCVPAAAIALLLSGCASSSAPRSALANSAGTDRSTALMSDSDYTSDSTSLGASRDDRSTYRPKLNALGKPSNVRISTSQRLGLFGELTSTSTPSVAIPDGSANMSQITVTTEGTCFDPDVDRTGTRLVFASTMHKPTSDIYIKSVTGKTITQITSDPADDVMPTFSPDGDKIAFASNRTGNWDIYITNLDGGGTVQISTDADPELHPSFSPDGKHLVYCKLSSQSNRWQIYLVDVANPSVKRYLQDGMFPQWNPNPAESKILFQQARQRGSRYHSIWTVDYVNGEAIHPTEIVSAANAAAINPNWSPDGNMIVFVTVVDPENADPTEPQISDIWIVNVDGTGRTELTNGECANYQPVWGTDGTVYFVSDRGGNDNIWAASTGRSTFMADQRKPEHTMTSADPDNAAPSSDGRH